MKKNINAFMGVLDASDNSTGGGTASCVAGSMAAGLIGMVARLSVGKAGLGPADRYERIAKRAKVLSRELFDGGRIDSEAFAVVSSAFKLPKQTQAQKRVRSMAIQEGIVHCAKVPLANARLCREVLDLADGLAKKFNTNATSDLQCGQYLAVAGLKGCAANVRINLLSIKDKAVAERIEGELAVVLSKTEII